jgi:hypothetical protein
MAGDWIKMRVDLREDPTVFKIAEAIGDDDLTIVGRLFSFWAWADKHAVDGRVDGAATKLIDRVVGKVGFADALVDAGWLILDTSGASIPNFDRHNGESAKERSLKNARQARWREKKNANVDAAPSTEPSTREEKRREEKSNSVPNGTGGKPPMTPDEIIFGYGLSLLTNAGTAEKQARSFLGGLRKQHGDETLIDRLRDCAKAKPLQPLEWLAAALPPGGAPAKPNRQEAIEQRNHAGAEAWAAQGVNHAAH